MQNDSWYILIGESHTGPFARTQILKKIHNKEISRETYLWMDGMPEWKLAMDISEWKNEWSGLNLEDEMPPPLPPLPEELEDVWQEAVALGPSERDFFDGPKISAIKDRTTIFEESMNSKVEVHSQHKMPWGLVVAAALFFSLSIYLLYPRYQLQDLDVQGISQTDYSKFLDLSKNASSYQFASHLALSIDGSRLWLGVNKSGPLFLRMRLRALKDQVLPPGDVEVVAEFHTAKFATLLENYKIVKGSDLHPGYYELQIDGQGVGIFSKLMLQLKNIPLISMLPFVQQYQRDFTYTGKFFLGPIAEGAFLQKLSEFKLHQKDLEQKPVVELLEFYRTFETLYGKLETLYLNILGQIQAGTGMHLFEKEYVVGLAPIYQSMMIEINEKKARKVEGQSFDEIQFIAREFGLLVSDMLGETRRLSTISEVNKQSLKAKFTPRVKKFRDLCNEQLKILQNYVQ